MKPIYGVTVLKIALLAALVFYAVTVALPAAAIAQPIIKAEYLVSARDGSWNLRASATSATVGRCSDSTAWLSTDGWESASVQYSFTDSTAAVDSTSYTIFARWSNDGTTACLTDSLPHEDVEGAVRLDAITMRDAQYVKFVVWAGPGSESGAGATTYALGHAFLCVRGTIR